MLFEARKEKMGTNVQNNSELEGREEEVLHNKPESPLLFTPEEEVLENMKINRESPLFFNPERRSSKILKSTVRAHYFNCTHVELRRKAKRS